LSPTWTLLLGRITKVHVRNAVLAEDGKTVDPAKLLPIGRLGGNVYSRLGETFMIPRPAWKDDREGIEAKIGPFEGEFTDRGPRGDYRPTAA
jgi:hypothetical protein